MIYFIRCRELNAVKIGFSIDPKSRLSQLQTSCAATLDLWGAIEGDEAAEKALHGKFSAYRERGEWVRDAPQLLGKILDLIEEDEYRRIWFGVSTAGRAQS